MSSDHASGAFGIAGIAEQFEIAGVAAPYPVGGGTGDD
jgi:hypothetical protein